MQAQLNGKRYYAITLMLTLLAPRLAANSASFDTIPSGSLRTSSNKAIESLKKAAEHRSLVRVKGSYYSLFGHDIKSPIGLPACTLTANSEGIKYAAQLGYDILVYKTIRSSACPAHPYPNITYVDIHKQLSKEDLGHEVEATDTPSTNNVAISNSHGNNSMGPEFLLQDIKRAHENIGTEQLLIVSVYGTGDTFEQTADDFARTAALACKAGAKVIEANISCPNVFDNKTMFADPDKIYTLTKRIVDAIDVPLVIKLGYLADTQLLRQVVLAIAHAGAHGICGINSIPMKIKNKDGSATFGKHRATAGISGNPIRELALEFIQKVAAINKTHNLGLTILATGGATKPEHFMQFLMAGADIAMSATGSMANPYLAIECHRMMYEEWQKNNEQETNRLRQLTSIEGKATREIEAELYALVEEDERRELINSFHEKGIIKFGSFKLKSGITSPVYVDLRTLISHPKTFQAIVGMTTKKSCDLVCGVPYGAIPLATAYALRFDKPMIILRKQAKDHGTKKMVEGKYKSGQNVLLIEDVITSGTSIKEAITSLENTGLAVTDIIVILDREQGGKETLEKKGYHVHTLFTLSEVFDSLRPKLDEQTFERTQAYLAENQCK